MRISKFFKEILGAELKNVRWSWGAIDRSGRIFLRVWDDEVSVVDGSEQILIALKKPRFDGQGSGWKERLSHVQAIQNGAEGFGIVCTAVDTAPTGPRQIKHFDERYLLRFGEVKEGSLRFYARIAARIPVSEFGRARAREVELGEDLKTILGRPDIESTTAETLIAARIGQGAFRANVLRLWDYRCAVTGSSTMDALRASHIKPWRDSTDRERLDPTNGIPLLANFDALFDAGLISFESSGRMIVSPIVDDSERALLAVAEKSLREKPTGRTAEYLQYHRQKIFRR